MDYAVAVWVGLWTGIARSAGRAIVYPYSWGGGRPSAAPGTLAEALGLLAGGTDCSGAAGIIIWILTGRWSPSTVKGFQSSLQPLASYQGETGVFGFVCDSTGTGYHMEFCVGRAGPGVLLTLGSAGGGSGDIGLLDHNSGFGLRMRPESYFQAFARIPSALNSPLAVLSAGASAGSAAAATAPPTSAGGAVGDLASGGGASLRSGGASLKEGTSLK